MSYRTKYYVDVSHPGLGKYRRISGTEPEVVERRAQAQVLQWDQQWASMCEREQRKLDRENQLADREAKKAEALELTEAAQESIESLKSVLRHTLKINDAIGWEELRDLTDFPEVRPFAPQLIKKPRQPEITDPEFSVQLGLLDRLFSGRRRRKEFEAASRYDRALAEWKVKADRCDRDNEATLSLHARTVANWESRKSEFGARQSEANAKLDDLKRRYEQNDAEAVEEYNDIVFTRSSYPDFFPKGFELAYVAATKMLIVDYQLPSLEDMPTLKAVRYVQSRDEFEETHLREGEISPLYDSLCYQICLRTIHEAFEADVVSSLNSVVFNGWVDFIDPASGNQARACILSLQAIRDDFLKINLAQIDPKKCFLSLKGVGSSKLSGMVAIAPIAKLDKTDSRFVPSIAVADSLHEGINLASIDWEEFEHLVREIFGFEFSQNGGEVKVTRASRDGGVDAVAFDPDPIRGGKLVIQAKRYTSPVGVSAVRDLYGTMMNEGAIKGILVTTSTYGPDAYEFAKGKPLTLLNGSNLLHLLERHGHRAYIDLKEAKASARAAS